MKRSKYADIFLLVNKSATKIEIACKYLTAIQSCVEMLVVYPKKIFIPLYETVWNKSIIPMKNEETPMII